MAIALIAIDLDGTLFDSQQRVPEANRDALLEAQARGVRVVLSSGRAPGSVGRVARGIGLNGPVITSNGALALDADGAAVFNKPLNAASLRQCLEYLTLKKTHYILFSGDTLHVSPHAPHIDDPVGWEDYLTEDGAVKVQRLRDIEAFMLLGAPAHKIAVVDDRYAVLRALREDVERIPGIEVNSAWSDNIEIMDGGVSKGAALTALAAHLGIPMADVMAIGDNENDLTMLKAAGVSVAMGNALDCVKAVCGHVTLGNNEAGVAHAVRSLAL